MATFVRHGDQWQVVAKDAADMHKKLPVGNYLVKECKIRGFFLEHIDPFVLPDALYGDTTKQAARIINTFEARPLGTGVLLSGEKGAGKSLLAKVLSVKCAEAGIPTILVNEPHVGDGFNKLMTDIDQPTMVLFDEFEKVYDKDAQPKVLTLLDGVFQSKKLWVLTCNDPYLLDRNLQNRPGRLFYALEFAGLDAEFIKQYCKVNLDQGEYIEQVCSAATLFDAFSFDMLQSLVQEMNRYKESPYEALRYLNIKVSGNYGSYELLSLIYEGTTIRADDIHCSALNRHPASMPEIHFQFYIKHSLLPKGVPPEAQDRDERVLAALEDAFDVDDDNDEEDMVKQDRKVRLNVTLKQEHLLEADGYTGTYVYHAKGVTATFTKERPSAPFDMHSYLNRPMRLRGQRGGGE